MHRFLTKIFATLAVLAALMATPAMAQATRTWVSGVGDDANPCSPRLLQVVKLTRLIREVSAL
jgi:hypothetical protein